MAVSHFYSPGLKKQKALEGSRVSISGFCKKTSGWLELPFCCCLSHEPPLIGESCILHSRVPLRATFYYLAVALMN